jgi:hypothetical protein
LYDHDKERRKRGSKAREGERERYIIKVWREGREKEILNTC